MVRFAVGARRCSPQPQGLELLHVASGQNGIITRSVRKNLRTSMIDEFSGALVVSWECSEITAAVRSFRALGMAPVVKCVSVLLPPT